MSYLVFDIETTNLVKCPGFNIYPDITKNEPYDSARMVQIGWVVLDNDLKIIEKKNYIIKRDGFNIEKSNYHNITNEISDIHGVRFEIVMQDFGLALYNCEYIVAHNVLFDFHVLANHLFRYRLTHMLACLLSKKKFCTSVESTNILKIPLRYSNSAIYKFPSLKEAYRYYFDSEFENHHDALSDAVACSKVFIKIINDTAYTKLW